jgi:hypothetical protein
VDRYEELRGWVTEALNLPGAPCGEAREALLRALRETPRRAQLEAIEKRRTLYGTVLAMLTSGEALRAAFESLHGALGDEVGVNVTTRIVREAVLAAKVAAWTKAAGGGVLEEGRASVIDWLRSDEAGGIAAGAAGDPWCIAGRLADALEGDEQRRAPAAGGGSGARARAGVWGRARAAAAASLLDVLDLDERSVSALRAWVEEFPGEPGDLDEGGEDGPAVLVVPRPKLDALRELTSSGAHVCSCGGCEPQAFADCCRFEAALRELVGA